MQTFAPRGKIHGPILPQFVLETSVSFGAKIMYALLCNYASDSDHCWPSQATLAARLSCSVSSVKKYLAELTGAQLVLVRREQYRSSVYYMLQPAALQATRHTATKSVPQATKPACRQPDSACVQPNSGYINTLNKQEERKTPPLPPVRSALPEVTTPALPSALGGGGVSLSDFEKAWEFYPKKEARGLARAAWLHLARQKQLPTLAEIETSIRHFMASESWQREQGRFVPQMHNWLKGQRWQDASVKAAVKEAEAARQSADAIAARQREEDARKAVQNAEREALRPRFDAFAEKFQLHTMPWLRPMAFGLWLYLHTRHRVPAPADVPKDNSLGIVEFLQTFKRHCEEAAWRTASAPERAAHAVLSTFTAPRTGTAVSCGEALRHHPVFSRQPASQAFAKAV